MFINLTNRVITHPSVTSGMIGTLASVSQIDLEFGSGGAGVTAADGSVDSSKSKELRGYSEYRQLIKFNPDLQIYEALASKAES